jgi:hypothetical protein
MLALLMLASAAPASAKPPWVSIELPANPMNRSMRDAFLLVHSYHVGQVAPIALTGTATGMVNGDKRVLTLQFTETDVTGVSALRRTWPSDGSWVLAINAGGEAGSTALVSIVNGVVRTIEVPTVTQDGFTSGRKVTQADVDRALRALAASDAPSSGHQGEALALALVPVGIGLGWRRWTKSREVHRGAAKDTEPATAHPSVSSAAPR